MRTCDIRTQDEIDDRENGDKGNLAAQLVWWLKYNNYNHEVILDILSEIILYQRCTKHVFSPSDEISGIITQLSESIDNAVLNGLYKALHTMWYFHIDADPTSNPILLSQASSEPEILVWGYEVSCHKDKKIEFCEESLHIDKLTLAQLTAFWCSVDFAQIAVMKGVSGYEMQSLAAWEITAAGISKSHLKIFSLERGAGLLDLVTLEGWILLCNAISLSKIKQLIFHVYLNELTIELLEKFNRMWEVLCHAIKESNLDALDLSGMHLCNLSPLQWTQLYSAIQYRQIETLDLSLNYFYSIFNEGVNPLRKDRYGRILKTLCDLIRLPSLKKLKYLNDTLERVSEHAFNELCLAFADSAVEELHISTDSVQGISEHRLIWLIKSLRATPIKRLVVKYAYAEEWTTPIMQALCEMIVSNKLDSLSFTNHYGDVALPGDDWRLLANAIRIGNVKSVNLGSLNIDQSTIDDLCAFIQKSQINKLNLQGGDFNLGSPKLLNKLARCIKKSHVSTLKLMLNISTHENHEQEFERIIRLLQGRGLDMSARFLQEVEFERVAGLLQGRDFERIARLLQARDSERMARLLQERRFQRIAKFLMDTGVPHVDIKARCDYKAEQAAVKNLSAVIQNSNMVSLKLNMGDFLWKMNADQIKMLFNAICNSRIIQFPLSERHLKNVSHELRQVVDRAFSVVEERNKLSGNAADKLSTRCVAMLFNQCNAKLTRTGITYQVDGRVINTKLFKNEKETIREIYKYI